MTQKRSYKQYLKEFKEEAVALITEQGTLYLMLPPLFGE
jgi:transposase-like protein